MISDYEIEELEQAGVDFKTCFYWDVQDDSMAPTFEPGQRVIVDEFRKEIVNNEFHLLRLKHINVIEIRRIYCENGLHISTCDNPTTRQEIKFLDIMLSEIPDDWYIGRVIYWNKQESLKAKK